MSILNKVLRTVSGGDTVQISEQLLYEKVIGVRSIVPGAGSTVVVQNLAKAIIDRTNYNVCIVDVNFMYPLIQYLMDVKASDRDMLDYTEASPKVVHGTRYMGMYYTGLMDRTLLDMMSTRDSKEMITLLIEHLKGLFDIILVDLSHETTKIGAYAAIKCNRIIQVADTSYGCITHLKKSQNTMVTLGVPQAKAKEVILNKQIMIADIGFEETLAEVGLDVIGEIPLSEEVALMCATGELIYGAPSKDMGVTEFNRVIDDLVTSLVTASPHLERYDASELKARSIKTKQEKERDAMEIVVSDEPGSITLDKDGI